MGSLPCCREQLVNPWFGLGAWPMLCRPYYWAMLHGLNYQLQRFIDVFMDASLCYKKSWSAAASVERDVAKKTVLMVVRIRGNRKQRIRFEWSDPHRKAYFFLIEQSIITNTTCLLRVDGKVRQNVCKFFIIEPFYALLSGYHAFSIRSVLVCQLKQRVTKLVHVLPFWGWRITFSSNRTKAKVDDHSTTWCQNGEKVKGKGNESWIIEDFANKFP